MRTGTQVQNDIIDLLKGSELVNSISGGLYRGEMRPKDSNKEDLLVMFTSGNGALEQEGDVTLNIYVPDIFVGTDGVSYQDSARCEVLEAAVLAEVSTWNQRSDYHFSLRNTIFSLHDDEIRQSFVVVRLGFKCLNY